jgi:hypothetical protein
MLSKALTRSGAPARRLVPLAELLSHLADVRDFYLAMEASGKIADVQALGRGYFVRSIEERLGLAGAKGEPAQLAAQAHALTGSVFALIHWWMDRGMKTDPREVDAMFHRMAWSGIQQSLNPSVP